MKKPKRMTDYTPSYGPEDYMNEFVMDRFEKLGMVKEQKDIQEYLDPLGHEVSVDLTGMDPMEYWMMMEGV